MTSSIPAGRSGRRWRSDGGTTSFTFAGVAMRVSIQDELGKIDLNQAEPALLAGLLQSAGLDVLAANDLADKIVDWRTAVPLKRVNGAKEEDYRAAGLSYRPRNGPFQSIGELLLVTFGEPPFDTATLRQRRHPRCVQSVHPEWSRNRRPLRVVCCARDPQLTRRH